jgi:hypothetical protein
MATQLHKKFPNEQIKSLFERYLSKEIELNYLLEILNHQRKGGRAKLSGSND